MTTHREDTEESIAEERKASVGKAFDKPDQGAPADPADAAQPAPGTDGVGESVTRRGEDVGRTEHEAGRYDTGTDGSAAQRPTGESTRRDAGGLNPDDK
ncbi:MAG: hypothetical protein QOC57_1682 [Ilumatobacteraceae bacterium]|jgi:hypothetical protein